VACKTGRYASVGSFFPHFGEEECLRGWNGSGTIFFSHCNLRCVFCQNFDISQAKRNRRGPCRPNLPSEQVSLLVLDVVDQLTGDEARGTVEPVRFDFSCFDDVQNFPAAAGSQVI
jgi:hypothetical protein